MLIRISEVPKLWDLETGYQERIAKGYRQWIGKANPKGESDAKVSNFVGQISQVTEPWLIIFLNKNRPFAPGPWHR